MTLDVRYDWCDAQENQRHYAARDFDSQPSQKNLLIVGDALEEEQKDNHRKKSIDRRSSW
jgi:hypothetical protein